MEGAKMPHIAQVVMDSKNIYFDEIIQVIDRGVRGLYGSLYSFDGATILSWIARYCEEERPKVIEAAYEERRRQNEREGFIFDGNNSLEGALTRDKKVAAAYKEFNEAVGRKGKLPTCLD